MERFMVRLLSRRLFSSALGILGLALGAGSTWAGDPKDVPGAQAIEQVSQDPAEKTSPEDSATCKTSATEPPAGEGTGVLPGSQKDQHVAQDEAKKTPVEQPLASAVVNGQDNDTGSYWTSLCQNGHWLGGAGVYVVAPFFESNRAFTSFQPPISGVGPTTTTSTDFDLHLTAAPRFWLGYVGEGGWGGRISAWFF